MEPKVGKYILDSLSIGMYSHPLMLIREYIQNSTDAIDEAIRNGFLSIDQARIDIKIDGKNRNLTIKDNGAGISFRNAWNILLDLGNSTKRINENRGFRGIGRLGGLGYCDVLKFVTKATNEDMLSINTWNCEKLRQLIKEENHLDSINAVKAATDFQQISYKGSRKDHFFEAIMLDLRSSRDILMNVPLIKEYISEVAPVPYKRDKFGLADKIEIELRKRVPKYETYRIFVNDEQIFKPYMDTVILRGDKKDKIQDVEFIEFKEENMILAFGWLAQLKLLGSISNFSRVGGIRVRGGNIQIGNRDLLNEFFREGRFNSYLLGEIFTIDERLVPNSRRDDFEDSPYREEFYEQFIRRIGLPFSKIIRQKSQERSKKKILDKDIFLIDQAKNMINTGYLAEGQKRWVIGALTRLKGKNHQENNLDEIIFRVGQAKHYINMNSRKGKYRHKADLKEILEIVYRESEDKGKAIKLINKILNVSN